ncbi:MAG: hypothetical protein L0241_24220 [Planctomycetia bacterium]|nr:hypothetical protein [Planctomycetia bacterium]
MSDKPLTPGEKAGVSAVVLTSGRVRLFIAAALFIGWLGWLSFAALTKSREPTVSRAQAAIATVAVVAEVKASANGLPEGVVIVKESLKRDGPAPESEIEVVNLPRSIGFTKPGQYLLLLKPLTTDGKPIYAIVTQPRSPGSSPSDSDAPKIYPWSDDVQKQVAKLYPR